MSVGISTRVRPGTTTGTGVSSCAGDCEMCPRVLRTVETYDFSSLPWV